MRENFFKFVGTVGLALALFGCQKMKTGGAIQAGSTVKIHYTLHVEGNVVDSASDDRRDVAKSAHLYGGESARCCSIAELAVGIPSPYPHRPVVLKNNGVVFATGNRRDVA